MRQQLPEGDRFAPVTGEVRKHGRYPQPEGERTALDQPHDRRRRIEFGDGCDRPKHVWTSDKTSTGVASKVLEEWFPVEGNCEAGSVGTAIGDQAVDKG